MRCDTFGVTSNGNFLRIEKYAIPIPVTVFPFPFPSTAQTYFHSHGIPMGIPFARGFPFTCTALLWGSNHIPRGKNYSLSHFPRASSSDPRANSSHYCHRQKSIFLHCAISLAAQCIVFGPVCLCVGLFVGFVCLWVLFVCGCVTTITRNCVHRSSQKWVCSSLGL